MHTEISLSFVPVDGTHSLFKQVEDLFNSTIKPLYGDQTQALHKISLSLDRKCELLVNGENIAGIIVYKKQPTQEFQEYSDAFELKTLFVVDAKTNSRRGLGTILWNRVNDVALQTIGIKRIAVTVSETKTESLAFFQKKGCEIVKSFPDKYIKGITEHLLIKELK
ncbi:GNAT family N-acetyltransferase [Parachlamydia acanthamoebae]|jgi:ribosomal protein S18 acetylase RimI-like enzyme|uniref:GNAT family N-acetyltransferase n=1 Tax=Parachlamydia acanthamoebae TaxID=83552 RepID=UPI0001C17C58|nr:GNAT family N-acetyltransferase [Parachlamydia acanthamoebae]EFB42392.1 hypothetical protein pah_c009o036 [Parachlamydia acanthamoebae str. Hall's coccus]